jgi:ribose/xylose/arabinose/galactoside ABC-type transport system permease subunit
MKRPKLHPQHVPILATIGVFVGLYLSASLAYEGFGSWFQFTSFFADNATVGLIAIGMTFVILAGGIDLSVGAMVAFSSIALGALLVNAELPGGLAVPLVLLLGLLFGAGQGVLIHLFRLPPFLVTLAGMFLARGLALVMTAEKRVSITNEPIYQSFSDFDLGGFTLPALVFILLWLLAIVLAHCRRFGRNVYAVGGDASSALLMGLPVGRTTVGVYALSGLCAGLGGVMHALGTGAGDASVAYMFELDAIAAVVIGGTLLSGGVGYVAGTMLGVLILGIIATVPSYQGNLNSWWTKIAIGLLLLAFIGLQRFVQARVRMSDS